MRDVIAETKAVIEVDGEAIDTSGFSYASDVLSVGDPFAVTVPNPRGRFTKKLGIGERITLKLSNAEVNGGTLTTKLRGRIVEREASSDPSGTRIQLNCADLGWHLANCCAPTWYCLTEGTFLDLFTDGYLQDGKKQTGLLDPAWGLLGQTDATGIWRATIQTSNEPTLAERLGRTSSLSKLSVRLNKAQAVAMNLMGVFAPLYRVQTEAGDKVFDVLAEYSRRNNLLVNVSSDGVIQVWNPDYTRKPLYKIHYTDDDQRRQRNNVLGVRLYEALQGRFTEVTCVGELVAANFATLDPNNFNAGKLRGTFRRNNFPFVHRKTVVDGEMFDSSLAARQAEWHYKRELFNSFIYEVTVKGHHQNGVWWESDTMCAVDDDVTGVKGNLYVASVRYERTNAGDITHVAMRLPNLLSAAFGVLPVTTFVGASPRIATAIQ